MYGCKLRTSKLKERYANCGILGIIFVSGGEKVEASDLCEILPHKLSSPGL
jgi:hypothetical protein